MSRKDTDSSDPRGAAPLTEDRQTHESLRRDRELLGMMMRNTPTALAVVEPPSWRYTLVNPAYQSIPGAPGRGMVGRTVAEVFPEAAAEGGIDLLERVARTGEPVRVLQYAASGGEGREKTYWNVDHVPLFGPDGRLSSVLILAHEVTEHVRSRKRLERMASRLRRNLDRTRAVLDTVVEGIVIADAEGNVLEMNPAALEVYGFDSPEQANRDQNGFVERYDLQELDGSQVPTDDCPLARVLRGERVRDWDLQVVDKTSGRTWIGRYGGAPVQDAHGRIELAVLSVQDVTGRKRMEQKLRESEERFRIMADGLPLIVWMHDAEGNQQFVNRTFCRFFGVTREEMQGGRWKTLFHPDDAEAYAAALHEAVRGRRPFHAEARVCRGDGRWRWIESWGRPRFSSSGECLGYVGASADVTERRRAEEELRNMREELERRVEARTAELERRAAQLARLSSQLTLTEQRERRRLGRFIHDHLQQLLVGAKINLEVATQELEPNRHEGLERAYELLLDSLQTARSLSAQMAPYLLYERGLAPAMEWLARTMQDMYPIEIETDIPSEVAVEREDLKVFLFESTRELLFNAVKHAMTSTARLEIREGEGELRITVRDRGVGFEVEELMAGLGGTDHLGLFTVRERLELMDGRLEVESALGYGAAFHLVVPLEKAASEAPAADRTAPAERTSELQPVGPGLRVLLVDDHVVMRQGLSSLLGRQPEIQVVGEAADGEEGVRMARELRPDVILMDISMPRMNGIDATRMIHAESPHIRIIGLSMYDDGETEKGMLEAGAAAFVNKSGHTEALLEAVRGD